MEITLEQFSNYTDEGTPGFSRESGVARRLARIIRERTYKTATRQPTKLLADDLFHLYVRCHEPNWDGYGASAVSAETLKAALAVTRFAPDFKELPEVIADPDGDIAFEWNHGDRSLTVAINAEREMAFAGSFDDDAHIRGSEKLDDKFPETIAGLISRVFGH